MEYTEDDDVADDMTIETSSMSSGPPSSDVPVPIFERRHRRGLHRTSRMAMGRMGRRQGGTEEEEESWGTADSPEGETEEMQSLQSQGRQVNWKDSSSSSPSMASSGGVTSSSNTSRTSSRDASFSTPSSRSTSWVGRSSPSSPWRKSSGEAENYDIEMKKEDPWVKNDPWQPVGVMYENWSNASAIEEADMMKDMGCSSDNGR